MFRLERFKTAQSSADSGFDAALKEIQAGGKRGHWIWYIFPQLSGLGSSPASQAYGIDSADEAAEFLRDSELRSRLLTITNAVARQLAPPKMMSLPALMGSDIDARKLVSSLTLFGSVARKLQAAESGDEYDEIVDAAQEVLAAAAAQGYARCAYTLRRLTHR
jgi:uncharacterized protein (DUF1810 family)